MSTITTINASDQITNSRSTINTNFSNLNTDKAESLTDLDVTVSAAAINALVTANPTIPTASIWMYGGASAPSGWLLCDGTAVSRSTYSALFAVIGSDYGEGDGSTTFNTPNLKSSVPLGYGQRTRTMTFDGASAVDPSTNEITVTSNQWLITGQAVALTGSALPTGLSAQTYYVIRSSATVIKLASTLANAQNGTAVDITADGSGTCTLTQTLTNRLLGVTGGEETHAMTSSELLSHTHTTVVRNSDGGGGDVIGRNAIADNLTTDTSNATGGNAAMGIMNPFTVVNFIIKT